MPKRTLCEEVSKGEKRKNAYTKRLEMRKSKTEIEIEAEREIK
jgi:hypothetical protein